MTEGRRYERTGILAVDPQAFTMVFAADASSETVDIGGIPVVTIRGPLEHHAGMWCDSYDAILARASEALSAPSMGVVLRIDSPGGLVSGCMETARAIRALADGSGKRLIAYVDGQACSAAYALACAAHSIVTPQSGTLGSIGVLAARQDASEAMEREGLRVTLVKSGARKGDGDPMTAVSADEIAALQDSVDTLAGLFFAHVATHRALSVEDVAAMQAGLRIGAGAVAAGLADVVGTLDDALAMARGLPVQTAAEPQEDPPMATTMAEALEALRAAAEGDDQEEAARAKRMLAAMDEEEEPAAEGDDSEPVKDEDEPAAESDEDKDETSAKAIAARALATAQRAERMQILATRPDLSADAKAKLSAVPVEALAGVLSAIPRASATPPKAAAPTLGEGQGGQSDGVAFGGRTIAPNAELDRAMGITKSSDAPIKRTATYTQFGTLTREQANAILTKNGGAR